ncbi:hypothetical protein I4F81_004846 [Pyropia yezoensis]|uniref:Uncharacterized protein n=1 Tax=Pyropia yezoensis TaxID=2788 RepID=A0ACC3BXL7_PYRYE|nr:hypothetical protein I4F81_004846 [Neopyropia yezoensis]
MAPTTSPPTAASIEPTVTLACGEEANRLAATAAHDASVAAATATAAAGAAAATAGALRRERAALATRIAAVVAAMPPLPPAAAAVRDDDVHDDGGGGGAPADAAAAAAAVHGRRLAALDAELAHRRDLLSATDRVGAAKRDSLRRRAAAEAFLAKLPAHARAVASSVAPIRAFYPAPVRVEGGNTIAAVG